MDKKARNEIREKLIRRDTSDENLVDKKLKDMRRTQWRDQQNKINRLKK